MTISKVRQDWMCECQHLFIHHPDGGSCLGDHPVFEGLFCICEKFQPISAEGKTSPAVYFRGRDAEGA